MAELKYQDKLAEARILVLDDEKPIRDLVSNMFKQYGATVETAADGRAGLQVLIDNDFDVLVVDLRMRKMDGITFLQEALKIWPWLGVVIITGYGGAESYRKIKSLGVTRLVEKPFGRDELVSNVAAEYVAKQEAVEREEMIPLGKIQQQLQMMRVIAEPALEAETLLEALRELTYELGRFLDFAIIGVLGMEGDEHTLILNISRQISKSFVKKLEDYLGQRYAALIGKSMPAEVRTEIKGVQPGDGEISELGETFCVPIMASGEVKGFLILAAPHDTEHDASDVSFIYHIANHLSTVFSALSRMRGLAIHDSMTGLYNRLHLEAELQDVWSWSKRYKRPLAVVIMDLDHFKAVNDTYGHLAGDKVLKEFAQLLQASGRESDIIGRYGGEEFIVVLQEASLEDGITYAERLLNETRLHVFCEGQYDLHLTVSLGVAYADQKKLLDSDVQQVVGQADQAMYAAKRAGRNCVRSWLPQQNKANTPQWEEDTQSQPENNTYMRKTPMTGGRVIIVDDDAAVRELLSVMLRKENYQVTTFGDGEKALQSIQQNIEYYDLLISDIQMPHIDGFELVNRAKAYDDSLICIIISGYATADNAIESLRSGAYDFLQKPFVFKQVSATVGRAMEYRKTLVENRQYQRHLSDMVRQKSASAQEALHELQRSYEFTLEALVGLLDAREKDTGDHSKRVRALAVRLGREMEVGKEGLKDLGYGALLHDIGKIGIPDRILLKPDKLTPRENEIMQRHPEIGYRVVAGSSFLENAAQIVYAHQERYDGSGYPRGLRDEEICLGARIFAVIDTYDAMRTTRVYRDALPEKEVIAEIKKQRGRQFDPEVVDAFLRCRDELGKIYKNWQV